MNKAEKSGVDPLLRALILAAMPKRSSKLPIDVNQRAKRILETVTDPAPEPTEKNPAAVALGRLGGLKGGKARAKSLTPEARKAIAEKASQARWSRKKDSP